MDFENPAPGVDDSLKKHQQYLEESAGVVKVGDKTSCVIGFGGNINFIEGSEGVVVFNTGWSIGLSREAIAACTGMSGKPVRALVYSHGYVDHTGGAPAFLDGVDSQQVDIYANATWPGYVGQAGSPAHPEAALRIASQMGLLLEEGAEGTVGCAISRPIRNHGGSGYRKPTHGISERTSLRIAGIDVELIPAPHDLDDGLIMWLPDEKILFAGDILLPADLLPTLATPRFEPRRDPQKWVDSMALAASLDAEMLVTAWGPPVIGREEVRDRLTGQQRVAQFMVDGVYRRILAGELADDIAADFPIPASITGSREYKEHYHRLAWIVRSLIAREFGQATGDPLDLVRLSPREGAVALAKELGGQDAMVQRAAAAFERGDFRWALELATIALRLEGDRDTATALRIGSMRALAYASPSANERNYLLTAAAFDSGALDRGEVMQQLVGTNPTDIAFEKLPTTMLHVLGPKLRLDRTDRSEFRVRFQLRDRDETLGIHVLPDVVIREPGDDRADALTIVTNHENLIRLCEGMNDFHDLASDGRIAVTSGQELVPLFVQAFHWRFSARPLPGKSETKKRN